MNNLRNQKLFPSYFAEIKACIHLKRFKCGEYRPYSPHFIRQLISYSPHNLKRNSISLQAKQPFAQDYAPALLYLDKDLVCEL